MRRSRCGVAAGWGGAHVWGVLEICPDFNCDDIIWHCPVCGDNGAISGWQGTFWDNSDMPERPL